MLSVAAGILKDDSRVQVFHQETPSPSSRVTREQLHEIIFEVDTKAGQTFASPVMMLGYGIVAIPTGIVATELVFAHQVTTQSCSQCIAEGHAPDAKYCKFCGAELIPESNAL